MAKPDAAFIRSNLGNDKIEKAVLPERANKFKQTGQEKRRVYVYQR